MKKLERKKINLLIDFDSTFIKGETLDLLSEISLQKHNDKKTLLKQISKITSKAMIGKMSFSVALEKRINLINAHKNDIELVIDKMYRQITDSFILNKDFFKSNYNRCFIISGGFTEIIYPIVKLFNIPKKNIYANNFIYNKDNYITSIDKNNPLANDRGKVEIAKKISGKNIIIGDGYTDYEIKKFGYAAKFIQFVENINRMELNSKADFKANNFNEILSYINNKYNQ